MNDWRFPAIVGLVVTIGAIGPAAATARRQAPSEAPLPGPGLTRQQIIDKLTAADYQSKPSSGNGKVLFEGLCSNCHIFGDIGTSVGPDLSTLSSRFRKRDLLEAILLPDRRPRGVSAGQPLEKTRRVSFTSFVKLTRRVFSPFV